MWAKAYLFVSPLLCSISHESSSVDVHLATDMDGYTRLAALIGNQPEYAIFRRYLTLRSLQLLHLTARIAQLEDKLGEAIKLDRTSGDPTKTLYEFYYWHLEKSQISPEPSKQLDVWNELGPALKLQGNAVFSICFNY